MSILSYMQELQDLDKPVTASGLAQLSGLMDTEEQEFRDSWGALPPERRFEVIGKLSDLADDNAEMDFQAVFTHAMTDEEPAVRERAVQGLWETDDRRAIPKLLDRLENDVADEVRAAAAQVLAHFVTLADEGKLVRRDVDRLWGSLKAAMEDDDEPITVRRRVLEAIAGFRDPKVRTWIQWAYDHPEALIRQSAIYAMGRSQDAVWLDIIVGEMDSDDPGMRYEAANAARELGEDDALPYLADLVHDPDAQVSMAALHAIAGIGGAKARNMLKGYVAQSSDPTLREAAGEALAALEADVSDFSMMKMVGEPDDEDDDEFDE